MADNKIQICITLKPSLVAKLTKIASDTGRTRSGLCGWLLDDAIKDKKLQAKYRPWEEETT